MKPLRYLPLGALALVAACTSQAPASTPPASPAAVRAVTPSAAATPLASPSPSAVAAVHGSGDNKYVTGPFTVTETGLVPLPQQYDPVTEQGAVIPQTCAEIDVKNTSGTYTGWIAPEVEFVKGHSVTGQVLDTEPADPQGGEDGGMSSVLAPGQSQVLYACPQGIKDGTYVEAQLVSVTYGTPGQGTLSGTVVQLKY